MGTTGRDERTGGSSSSSRPRVLASWLDGKRVRWLGTGEVVQGGVVEKVTDRDMVYVAGDNGKRYYLALYQLVAGRGV